MTEGEKPPNGGVVVVGGSEGSKEALRWAAFKGAPDLALDVDELSLRDESDLFHHYQLNYIPPSESGRRLARR